jgi:hypothetical protein
MLTLVLPVLLCASVAAPAGAPWSKQAPAEALLEPLADQEPAHLAISLQVADRAGLSQLLADLQDPASPRYHQWITPQQFGTRFGQPVAKYERIAGWLQAQGFTVARSPNRIFIEATGTARSVRRALGVQPRWFDDRGDRRARSFSGTPSLPEDFASQVLVIDGLDTRLRYHHHLSLGGGTNALGAGDFRALYDITPLLGNGGGAAGETLVILGTQVQNTPPSVSDITSYFQNVSLATATYNPITLPNPNNSYDTADANEEYELDVQMQSVGAPYAASINLVLAPSDEVFSTGYNYVVTNLATATVVSVSLGSCEAQAGLQYAQATEQLIDEGIAQGIAYFAAAGDSGADDCADTISTMTCPKSGNSAAIDFPADIPEVVAMGGTQFTTSANWNPQGNLTGYQEESVWNASNVGGGGGQSTLFTTKPSWQVGIGPEASDGVRDSPDLALSASIDDPGVVEYSGGGVAIAGGTSVASPLAAGIFATIAGFCKVRLGDVHPTLYSLGSKQFSSGGAAVFHDVTVGNNGVCGVTGFTASTGYDLASGWGSIDAAALAQNWPNCGTGVIPDAGPTVAVGTACTQSATCNTNGGTLGQCYAQQEPGADGGLQNTGFYGGYCTAGCVALSDGGLTASGCPVESVCLPQTGGGQSLCLLDCQGFFPDACGRTDNQYNCTPLNQTTDSQGNVTLSNFVCYPGCQADADCGAPTSGYVCDTATHDCAPTCAADVSSSGANLCYASGTCPSPTTVCGTPGAAIGSACTQDNDCPVGGFCITAADGFPGGYCSADDYGDCGENPTEVCGTSAECLIQDPTTNLAYCFAECNVDTDCRTGYSCYAGNPLPDGGAGQGICYPTQAAADGGSSSSSGSSSSGSGASSSNSGGNSAGNSSSAGNSGGNSSGNSSGNNSGSSNASSGSSSNGGGNNGGGLTGPAPTPKPAASSGCSCSAGAPNDLLWFGWLVGLGLRRRRT